MFKTMKVPVCDNFIFRKQNILLVTFNDIGDLMKDYFINVNDQYYLFFTITNDLYTGF